MSGSPTPVSSLIASSAWIEPTTPAVAPSTPASRHDGTEPAGGSVGNAQR